MPLYDSSELSLAKLVDALHQTFGDNDLIVARRQMREARGEVLARWQEVVGLLEQRRGIFGIGHTAIAKGQDHKH